MKLPADRDSWRRAAAILDEALELPAARRPAALDELCAGDADLRAEVEAFLAADVEAGGFLEKPVGDYASTLLASGPSRPRGAGATAAGEPAAGHRLGPYRVVREIGAGGMGVVYEGWDSRLDRRVALKLLPPEWSRHAVAKERFVREARAAAALDHPNICNVHDVGESDDGQLYIVMAHYRGETLERRIARGPLPPAEAREIAAQVARGLAHAHATGIVHRDVKPSNVMLTEGGSDQAASGRMPPDRAKILDFGIARVAGDAGLTRTGASPGTPAYMSPEQASGDPVDERTDVWSLGVMLYQMLTGRRPFRGDHPEAVIHAILNRDPEPFEEGVPADLARVVERALARDPASRYRRMNDLVAALERRSDAPARRWLRPIVAGIVAGVVIFGAWWASQPAPAPAPPQPAASEPAAASDVAVPVVGVVPFVNRTGDAGLDWYGEGVARLVADALAPSRHLQVVSAQRIELLLGAETSAELARRAAEDGIGFVMTGEILSAGQDLILASRLIATEDGRLLASHGARAPEPPGLLEAADEIARQARKGLGVPTTETVDVFAADFASDNPAAYELYLRGLRAFADYRYDEAEQAFVAALEEAPDFTMARYRLAHVLAVASRTDEALEEIRRAVSGVFSLADRDARYVRAFEAYVSRRYDDAISSYQEILQHYPYETEARYLIAHLLNATGRLDERLEMLKILARLEPDNHIVWSMSGSTHLALGNLHQAMLDLQRYVELEPESANGHHVLGDAYRAQGELDLAAEEYSTALEIDPGFYFSSVALSIVDVLRDQRDVAERRLADLASDGKAAPRHRIDAAFELAYLHQSEGRFRKAEATLKALEDIIAGEKVREAMALSVRGNCRMELGDDNAARKLIDLAVERSPGVPSRYLFTRGLLELRLGNSVALEETVAGLLQGALPEGNPDRTEEKAAAYLRGLDRLAAGDIDDAIAELRQAVALEGYEYALYRLGLARAYLAASKLREAMATSRQAVRDVDTTKPRLDLELGRVRALLVLAQVQEALGRPSEAAAHVREILSRWAHSDPELPDLAEVRRLAAVTGE